MGLGASDHPFRPREHGSWLASARERRALVVGAVGLADGAGAALVLLHLEAGGRLLALHKRGAQRAHDLRHAQLPAVLPVVDADGRQDVHLRSRARSWL